jgi:3-oxoacyl-(acyl-carrier-protein) synthase
MGPAPGNLMRRVVITGMGVISSIGIPLDEVARSRREGRSRIGIDLERRRRGFVAFWPSKIRGSTSPTASAERPRPMMDEVFLRTLE